MPVFVAFTESPGWAKGANFKSPFALPRASRRHERVQEHAGKRLAPARPSLSPSCEHPRLLFFSCYTSLGVLLRGHCLAPFTDWSYFAHELTDCSGQVGHRRGKQAMHHEADSASCPLSARPEHQRPPALDHPITPAAHVRGALPFSCWKQEALLSGSSGCRRTPLLGGGLSYSLSGSMACSLSTAGSECRGRDCGNPNIKREEKKSKAPQSRKPAHQAPIQRGSSGVMSRLPATRRSAVSGRGVAGPALGRGFESAAQRGLGRVWGRGSRCRAKQSVVSYRSSRSSQTQG